ncbi:hypothetical protein NMS_0189 [Nonlabens marinus S1-08]|uniref:Uncharacterized protein n=1 Tax=Nonlabens marinus S1-08 TaxID=1454201 RepID=W8VU26_9FLAO|nr:hypothetical protein NMS_0189 [Nonlabens marinus S1-08]
MLADDISQLLIMLRLQYESFSYLRDYKGIKHKYLSKIKIVIVDGKHYT